MAYADMERMFAYGQPDSHLWVVGLEEHCGESDLELRNRIKLRELAGEYICLDDFHTELLGRVPTNVSVWSLTLQIYQGIFGRSTKLGGLVAEESDVLLAEILPLPRPQHHDWPERYREWWPDGPRAYVANALPRMSHRLVARVRKHSPPIVLLHGKTTHRKWIRDLGARLDWEEHRLGARRNETAELLLRDGTLWILANNLVNTGRVIWGDQQINALVEAIRSALPGNGVRSNC